LGWLGPPRAEKKRGRGWAGRGKREPKEGFDFYFYFKIVLFSFYFKTVLNTFVKSK
jgi:hypothetical protein